MFVYAVEFRQSNNYSVTDGSKTNFNGQILYYIVVFFYFFFYVLSSKYIFQETTELFFAWCLVLKSIIPKQPSNVTLDIMFFFFHISENNIY